MPRRPGMSDHPRLVLASASPRRSELLELLGLRFSVRAASIDERPEAGEQPTEFVLRAARDKALAVARSGPPGVPVLGADTVVEVDGDLLGKPATPDEAAAMLRRLSGRVLRVHTGVALIIGGRCEGLVDTAAVRFRELDDATVRWYVDTGEPLDKAGAYAVQGAGGLLVVAVEGSPQTVIGLPVHRLPELFALVGLDLWDYLEVRG